MQKISITRLCGLLPIAAFSLVTIGFSAPATGAAGQRGKPPGLRKLVAQHAAQHRIPPKLAHAVVTLESGYRSHIIHKGNYGLMQVRLGTARAMGFRGKPRQLLNPDTNLHYGMAYLTRAWHSSRRNICRTIKRYRTGTPQGRMTRATLVYCAKAKRLMALR